MRADMAKVIVERPRWGSDLPPKKKGYRRSLQKFDVAELPRREPLPGRWRGLQKSLNEHLGPMRRFLRSQVGRPWNKVHQDLCEHVSFDDVIRPHHRKMARWQRALRSAIVGGATGEGSGSPVQAVRPSAATISAPHTDPAAELISRFL
jgi:hypothetical protein